MQLTSIDEADALGATIPCRSFDPEVFFAETPADVEYAKSLCGTCPVKEACLAAPSTGVSPGASGVASSSSRASW